MADKQRKRTDPPADGVRAARGRQGLTDREREILDLLAEGLSGAEIANRLVLSPETVRTHVRNAMTKLGASTRSQAVALSVRRDGDVPAVAPAKPGRTPRDHSAALARMVGGLVSLYDLDGGAVYLTDDDGLALSRAATAGTPPGLADQVALGDRGLGRVALERRTRVLTGAGNDAGTLLAAPLTGGGRLVGVIALVARASRPVGRRELLLLNALAARVGEILANDEDVGPQLESAIERFRGSWSSAARSL